MPHWWVSCGKRGREPISAHTLPCTQAEKYGKEVIIADRHMVESGSDAILEPAKTEDVSFLVVGDALW